MRTSGGLNHRRLSGQEPRNEAVTARGNKAGAAVRWLKAAAWRRKSAPVGGGKYLSVCLTSEAVR